MRGLRADQKRFRHPPRGATVGSHHEWFGEVNVEDLMRPSGDRKAQHRASEISVPFLERTHDTLQIRMRYRPADFHSSLPRSRLDAFEQGSKTRGNPV
jgi:hypothetical protein